MGAQEMDMREREKSIHHYLLCVFPTHCVYTAPGAKLALLSCLWGPPTSEAGGSTALQLRLSITHTCLQLVEELLCIRLR